MLHYERVETDLSQAENPVYDEDLGFCENIMEAVMQQCIYENEINQRAMAGRKAVQMQEAEQAVENAADMGKEKNGLNMQINGS